MRAVRPNSVITATMVSFHRLSHAAFDCGNCTVERSEQIGESAARSTFGGMGIPAVERERPDTRPIRPCHKLRGGAGRFGEVSAYARRPAGNRSEEHTSELQSRQYL